MNPLVKTQSEKEIILGMSKVLGVRLQQLKQDLGNGQESLLKKHQSHSQEILFIASEVHQLRKVLQKMENHPALETSPDKAFELMARIERKSEILKGEIESLKKEVKNLARIQSNPVVLTEAPLNPKTEDWAIIEQMGEIKKMHLSILGMVERVEGRLLHSETANSMRVEKLESVVHEMKNQVVPQMVEAIKRRDHELVQKEKIIQNLTGLVESRLDRRTVPVSFWNKIYRKFFVEPLFGIERRENSRSQS